MNIQCYDNALLIFRITFYCSISAYYCSSSIAFSILETGQSGFSIEADNEKMDVMMNNFASLDKKTFHW